MRIMPPRNISNKPNETPLSVFLWGGKDKFEARKQLLEALTTNPIFSKRAVTVPSLSRKDAWVRAVHQARELIALKQKEKWSHEQFRQAVVMLDYFLPVQPQFRIFLSNMERQMSDEQKAIWMPKAERLEIFGSYAQTELGHGSNVRGIETTATFDRDADEFVINSPTLSSTKYWIGATGIWATHSLVVARLIIHAKDYGNHLFLIQLRDLDTQELMPGVEIYELGPKAFQGMVGVDNGAMQFHNVRIPRSQMLARNAQVLRDGTYVPPKNTKHSYGSMVTVRAIMVEATGYELLKAVSVAYHYTTFRKQFWRKGQEEETTVFDYASVKYRLLPLLAQGTALVLVGQNIKQAFDEYSKLVINTGDFSQLEDLHLQTVGAKVYSTDITARGVETCRIACGGHGYSALSGFGRMYAHTVNAVTYEGDNYVISQQVPRAILKHYNGRTESTVPSLSYLSFIRNPDAAGILTAASESDWFKLENQQWVLERRLATLVRAHLDATVCGKDTSFTVHELTMAHCDFVYWRGFWDVVRKTVGSEFYGPLEALAHVFSLSILQTAYKDVYSPHSLTEHQRKTLVSAYDQAIETLAEHSKSIIEAYGFTDFEMDSALARPDMDPYEALWQGARQSEMNNFREIWPLIVDARKIWRRLEEEKAKL
ncbi:acyl-coenzyme A oxidase 1 [Coccidioides immitis RMSCC 2394]|nr:acyl-coenzyme A oxidase 1 [Coccidioides immitis RMSCC 2394]